MATCELLRVSVRHDLNDSGEPRWFVTPYYRRQGIVMSVLDDRGWPTEAEARSDAHRFLNSSRKGPHDP